IRLVGNPMIDTLLRLLPVAMDKGEQLSEEPFALVTLHRPSNVDDPDRLEAIMEALNGLSDLKVFFPAHPRTLGHIEEWNIIIPDRVLIGKPLTYLNFIRAQAEASVVITDSGGVQEETSVLGVPCVTVRTSTERPVTLELGTSVLCPDVSGIVEAVARQIKNRPELPPEIPFWDGKAGIRIAASIENYIGAKR
ncbi:MAG: UDP-N-acetylglucosamine 2-epimerase, partial [Candidatus Aegiribacteria sp.]|nr:UDP-N-acetylglucosamine 2-epimerase [Candidatus Aegiribacteria sp.]